MLRVVSVCFVEVSILHLSKAVIQRPTLPNAKDFDQSLEEEEIDNPFCSERLLGGSNKIDRRVFGRCELQQACDRPLASYCLSTAPFVRPVQCKYEVTSNIEL